METTFDSIRDLDFEIHDVFEKNAPSIFEFIKTSKIPNTSQTFLRFITKTNFIKEGIFELYESENLYAINILFRSLIEHYLRFNYIFFRLAAEQNDNIGLEYLKFCSLSEDIDTGKAWKDVAKVLDKNPALEPYEVLQDWNPDLKKYTKEEIQRISSQFRYKNIIRFIDDRINTEKQYEKNKFLLNLIPVYSDLSSFVHGGPGADNSLIENTDKEKRENKLIERIEHSFITAAAVKQFTFLIFSQYDKQFEKGYIEIYEIMKKNAR